MGPFHLVLVFIAILSSFQPVQLAKAPLFARTQKFVKVEYFEDCDQKIYPMKLVNFTYVRNGSDLVFNGEEVISRDMKSPLKVQFLIDKCKDKSNPDTCEYYTTWKWDDVCAFFKMPFVGIALKAVTPPYSCPMKKNHYYIRNVKVPADLWVPFLAYSNPNVLWKFQFRREEGALTVSCNNFGLRLVNIRVRG